MVITKNVKAILAELPPGVELEAAAKTRTPEEIEEVIAAGVKIIGENYVQEAMAAKEAVKLPARWHFIGHLQKNKVKKAVPIFDLIETVDSLDLAREIDKRCQRIDKVMPVFIEVNSGREPQKAGVMPEDTIELVQQVATLSHIKVMGLMTMGPWRDDPEELRPYFALTRELFEKIKALEIPNVEMRYLSMGMSDSYKVAIEEGANLVRIGTRIFGERRKK
ncbi:MAG: YggS family pyridoxal phosphate-dependent enzyme [Candidatus Desulfofervidaceae bacterium]|nr:YggS family pyridoxal phosphate-dependent enzyme [Candidatus Desulfofervidaceae bacterium]